MVRPVDNNASSALFFGCLLSVLPICSPLDLISSDPLPDAPVVVIAAIRAPSKKPTDETFLQKHSSSGPIGIFCLV